MSSFNWDFAHVADDLGLVLAAAEADLRTEQAVYGLDGQDEQNIQSLLAGRLAARYQIAREVHYPGSRGRKLSHRPRCDLVLSPLGSPLEPEEVVERLLFDPPAADLGACKSRDALWLEVKVAFQFREGGIAHRGYGPQWRQKVVADLRKMEADELIREAGLVLIVFNESREILEKDLDLFEEVLIEKEVLAGFRQVRSIPILDRIGHKLCTAALWPTIQR